MHRPGMTEKCADRDIALCVVTPTGLTRKTDDYLSSRIDERNANYHLINHIIPQLEAIPPA